MKSVYVVMLGLLTYTVGCVPEDDAVEWETNQAAITGLGSSVSYTKGLIRLDLNGSIGGCSGFLIAPNMIATAAHCVDDNTISGSHDGIWNGMKWGEIRARVVYKPSSSEVICLEQTCRDSSNNLNFPKLLTFWDSSYVGLGGSGYHKDVAIITRLDGKNFVAKRDSPSASSVRALNSGDYLRILKDTVPTNTLANIMGYGATSDTSSTLNPVRGRTFLDHWDGGIRGKFRAWRTTSGSAICAGDSGGLLAFKGYSLNYAAGIASKTSSRNGACPESGDNLYWSRPGQMIWMINRVKNWAGLGNCWRYNASGSNSDVPGGGEYYKCW